MRRVALAACTAVLLLAQAAGADVLKLSNGGELKGTLRQIIFDLDGKRSAHPRDAVASVWVSLTEKDSLKLKDGTTHRGELVSMEFKTLGGLMTFPRKEVLTVLLGDTLLEQARKELQKKRATIADADAVGLYELARWCLSKRLKDEARRLAEASLKADPNGKFAEKAHRLLGHVRYKGEWMTREEMIKRKKADGDGPAPGDKPKTDPNGNALSPEQRKALTDAIAKNDDLRRAYLERLDDQRKEALGLVEAKYKQQWNEANQKVKDVLDQIDGKKDEWKEEVRKYRRELEAKHLIGMEIAKRIDARFGKDCGHARDVDRLKGDLRRVARDRAKVAAVIKAAQSRVTRKVTTRKERIFRAFQKNKLLLQSGKLLTLNQMTDTYDTALKKKN